MEAQFPGRYEITSPPMQLGIGADGKPVIGKVTVCGGCGPAEKTRGVEALETNTTQVERNIGHDRALSKEEFEQALREWPE